MYIQYHPPLFIYVIISKMLLFIMKQTHRQWWPNNGGLEVEAAHRSCPNDPYRWDPVKFRWNMLIYWYFYGHCPWLFLIDEKVVGCICFALAFVIEIELRSLFLRTVTYYRERWIKERKSYFEAPSAWWFGAPIVKNWCDRFSSRRFAASTEFKKVRIFPYKMTLSTFSDIFELRTV